MKLTREEAIELARRRALNSLDTHAYLPVTDADAATWMPHEWVIDAIMAAAERGAEGASDKQLWAALQLHIKAFGEGADDPILRGEADEAAIKALRGAKPDAYPDVREAQIRREEESARIDSLIDSVVHNAMGYAQDQHNPHASRRLTEAKARLTKHIAARAALSAQPAPSGLAVPLADALSAHKERWAFKLREMRHYLSEAHQFAAMSPRGKENIATALEILDEIEAVAAPSPQAPATAQEKP